MVWMVSRMKVRKLSAQPPPAATSSTTARAILGLVTPTRGGFLHLENGVPALRQVREGRPAVGRGWIGITPRNAYQTLDLRIAPLLPAWAFLLIAGLFSLAAWLREGRR